MSMGLKWVEATPSTGNYDNDEARTHMAADPCRYVLGLPVVAPAGRDFFYNTGALTLVSAIIRKATGRPLDEFARETLFEPLGITKYEWPRVKGDTNAGGGLRLRPRDMADGAMRRLALDRLRPRDAVIIGRDMALAFQLGGEETDGVVALAMDHHQRLLAARDVEDLEQLFVAEHEVVIGHAAYNLRVVPLFSARCVGILSKSKSWKRLR